MQVLNKSAARSAAVADHAHRNTPARGAARLHAAPAAHRTRPHRACAPALTHPRTRPRASQQPQQPPQLQEQQQQQQRSEQEQQNQQQQVEQRAALTGVWARDDARSDGAAYDKMLDVLGLTGLQRLTARLIDGLELSVAPGSFTVKFLTVVPFFKVTETYPARAGGSDGGGSDPAPARLPRRDLRPGTQTAVASATADGGLRVEFAWGEPLAGTLTEEYALLPDGALRVRAVTAAGGRRAAADTIYRRTAASAEELLQKRRGGGGGARR